MAALLPVHIVAGSVTRDVTQAQGPIIEIPARQAGLFGKGGGGILDTALRHGRQQQGIDFGLCKGGGRDIRGRHQHDDFALGRAGNLIMRGQLVQFTVVEPPTQRPCRILIALSSVLRAALSW